MKKSFKIFIFVAVFAFFVLPPKNAEAGIADAIGKAVWGVFMTLVESETDRVAEKLGGFIDTETSEIDNLSFQEQVESRLNNFIETNFDSDESLDFNDSFGGNITDPEYRRRASVETDRITDSILTRLRNEGFFDSSFFPFTEDQVENLLQKFYLEFLFDDISSVVDSNQVSDGGEQSFEFLEISYTPTSPVPGDEVDFILSQYSGDVNNSYVEWFVDGRIVLAGVGESRLDNYLLNQEGLPETVGVIVVDAQNKTYRTSVTVRPAEIALIYETNTQTPPFYAGKTDVSHESTLKIVALPYVLSSSGQPLSKDDFSYKWFVNGNLMGEQSGRSNNVLYHEISFIEDQVEIFVEITNASIGFNTTSGINILTNDPEVVVYQDHPTLGVLYNNAIGEVLNFSSEEISLRAFPFFFNQNDALSYQWSMNGNEVRGDFSNTIVLRNENNESGASRVEVSIRNEQKRIQNDSTLFDIIFSN